MNSEAKIRILPQGCKNRDKMVGRTFNTTTARPTRNSDPKLRRDKEDYDFLTKDTSLRRSQT